MDAEGQALFQYLYEFRSGNEILATGHLGRDEPLDLGDTITIAGQRGIVTQIEPRLGNPGLHLTVERMEEH